MAARLGLDNARLPELLNPNPHREDDELWRTGDLDENTLRSTLIITNRLLQTQTITTEAKLLKTLANADGVLSWLVDGLNLTTKDAVELSQTVNYQPWPIENLAANAGEILLECADGLQVWRSNSAAPEPLLTGYFPESSIGAFSPDGQKLIARISGQLAVIDFSTGTLIWLPNGHSAYNGQWLDNKTLTYELFGDAIGVRLYELYVGEVLAFDSDIRNYTLSPDGQQAVITRFKSNRQVLYIMPVRGGEEQQFPPGFQPQWLNNEMRISFVQSYKTGFRILVKNFQTGQTETVLDTKVLGPNFEEEYTSDGLTPTVWDTQWSKQNNWLAFSANMMGVRWVGLVRQEGQDLQLLINGLNPEEQLRMGGFSADENYFALAVPGEGVRLHHLTNNKTRTIAVAGLRDRPSQWSPTGYDILISTAQGIQILRDAHQANPRLESISGPECTSAVWVPAPQP
jgi:hypothetical protein